MEELVLLTNGEWANSSELNVLHEILSGVFFRSLLMEKLWQEVFFLFKLERWDSLPLGAKRRKTCERRKGCEYVPKRDSRRGRTPARVVTAGKGGHLGARGSPLHLN